MGRESFNQSEPEPFLRSATCDNPHAVHAAGLSATLVGMRTKAVPTRRTRWVVTGAVVAALIAPVAFDRDSFPLSTYPMYSRARSGESTLITARGLTVDGSTRELTPTLIGDSDDPLVVVGRLRAALSAGRGDVRCVEIADRVGGRSALADVVTIEIVAERHDTVARTLDDDSLIERDVRATCEVERS